MRLRPFVISNLRSAIFQSVLFFLFLLLGLPGQLPAQNEVLSVPLQNIQPYDATQPLQQMYCDPAAFSLGTNLQEWQVASGLAWNDPSRDRTHPCYIDCHGQLHCNSACSAAFTSGCAGSSNPVNWYVNGTLIGTEPGGNFNDGTNTSWFGVDDPINHRVDVHVNASGGAGGACGPVGEIVEGGYVCVGPPILAPLAPPILDQKFGYQYTGTSLAVTLPQPNVAGNQLLVPLLTSGLQTCNASMFSDTVGGTYSIIYSGTEGGTQCIALATTASSGTATVTVSGLNTNNYQTVGVFRTYNVNALDTNGYFLGGVDVQTGTATMTTTTAGDLLIGAASNQDGALQLFQNSGDWADFGTSPVQSGGSEALQWGWSGSYSLAAGTRSLTWSSSVASGPFSGQHVWIFAFSPVGPWPTTGAPSFRNLFATDVPSTLWLADLDILPTPFLYLPTCTAGSLGTEGTFRSVTDSTTATQGATITGGGGNHVSAYCNGTHWVVTSGAGGGTSVELQTIGTDNSSQSLLDFITSTVNADGLIVTPSNPSGGQLKFEISGAYTGSSQIPQCYSSGSGGSAYACTTSLTSPDAVILYPDAANSGSSATLNVNSTAACPIYEYGGTNSTLHPGDIAFPGGTAYLMLYVPGGGELPCKWIISSQINAGSGFPTLNQVLDPTGNKDFAMGGFYLALDGGNLGVGSAPVASVDVDANRAPFITPLVFTPGTPPPGLNNATFSGTPTLPVRQFCVAIDSLGSDGGPDTFSWGVAGSCTSGATGVAITASAQLLTSGVSVTFAYGSPPYQGHSLGDQWTVTSSPGGIINAQTGFQIGYTAPDGHCLVGLSGVYQDGSCGGTGFTAMTNYGMAYGTSPTGGTSDTPPATIGKFAEFHVNPTAAATAPQPVQIGTTAREVTGSTDTIIWSDCAAGQVNYKTAASAAVALGTPASLSNTGCAFTVASTFDGTNAPPVVTITATSYNFSVNGGAGVSSFILPSKGYAFIYVDKTVSAQWDVLTSSPFVLSAAPSAGGNFTLAHGMGRIPVNILITMTSGGAIWCQTPCADGTNLLLISSDAGQTANISAW